MIVGCAGADFIAKTHRSGEWKLRAGEENILSICSTCNSNPVLILMDQSGKLYIYIYIYIFIYGFSNMILVLLKQTMRLRLRWSCRRSLPNVGPTQVGTWTSGLNIVVHFSIFFFHALSDCSQESYCAILFGSPRIYHYIYGSCHYFNSPDCCLNNIVPFMGWGPPPWEMGVLKQFLIWNNNYL